MDSRTILSLITLLCMISTNTKSATLPWVKKAKEHARFATQHTAMLEALNAFAANPPYYQRPEEIMHIAHFYPQLGNILLCTSENEQYKTYLPAWYIVLKHLDQGNTPQDKAHSNKNIARLFFNNDSFCAQYIKISLGHHIRHHGENTEIINAYNASIIESIQNKTRHDTTTFFPQFEHSSNTATVLGQLYIRIPELLPLYIAQAKKYAGIDPAQPLIVKEGHLLLSMLKSLSTEHFNEYFSFYIDSNLLVIKSPTPDNIQSAKRIKKSNHSDAPFDINEYNTSEHPSENQEEYSTKRQVYGALQIIEESAL